MCPILIWSSWNDGTDCFQCGNKKRDSMTTPRRHVLSMLLCTGHSTSNGRSGKYRCISLPMYDTVLKEAPMDSLEHFAPLFTHTPIHSFIPYFIWIKNRYFHRSEQWFSPSHRHRPCRQLLELGCKPAPGLLYPAPTASRPHRRIWAASPAPADRPLEVPWPVPT